MHDFLLNLQISLSKLWKGRKKKREKCKELVLKDYCLAGFNHPHYSTPPNANANIIPSLFPFSFTPITHHFFLIFSSSSDKPLFSLWLLPPSFLSAPPLLLLCFCCCEVCMFIGFFFLISLEEESDNLDWKMGFLLLLRFRIFVF